MTVTATVFEADGPRTVDDVATALAAEGPAWIHVVDPDASVRDQLIDAVGLHPLALSTIDDEDARATADAYDEHTFVMLKDVHLGGEDVAFHKEIRVTPVGFFLGDDWLVTVAPKPITAIDPGADRWRGLAGRILERGIDVVAYRCMDALVDGYFQVLDDVEDEVEHIEERVLDEPDPELLAAINDVRRDLLAFRKVAWPAREAVAVCSRGDAHVLDDNEVYFRDVHDRLGQVVDLVETYRDLTSGSRDIYLNTVSQSTNEVMKTLTVVATIFIPLTFVVGVYGMNFGEGAVAMPELQWDYAYPAVMLGMAAVAGVMLWQFREQDWL